MEGVEGKEFLGKLGQSWLWMTLRSEFPAQGIRGHAGLASLHCFALCAVLGKASLEMIGLHWIWVGSSGCVVVAVLAVVNSGVRSRSNYEQKSMCRQLHAEYELGRSQSTLTFLFTREQNGRLWAGASLYGGD